MSSGAGPSRSHVVTLTADQLLGASLTPARPHKQPKNAPRVLTIEDLLGSGLTVARTAPKPPAPPRSPPRAVRSSASASTRSIPNPRLVRVTADEVLRTGIPVRTLQVVKARSGQAQVLTAEELLASGSSRSSARRAAQSRGRPNTAEPSGGPSTSPRSAATASSSSGGTVGANGTRRTAAQQAGRDNEGSAASATSHNRSRQARRSNSLGSTRTLPMYTQEPGDSEVVIDRGATELEDDAIPITATPPVEENQLNAERSPSAAPSSSPPNTPRQTRGASLTRQRSPDEAIPPVIASSLPNNPPPWTSVYADAAPSYEAVMSTPNLHIHPVSSSADVPVLASPVLNPAASEPSTPSSANAAASLASPRPTVRVLTTPSVSAAQAPPSSQSPVGSSSPPGERADGAETPRRRFRFMSIFHSSGSSRRARSHSHSLAIPQPSSSLGHSSTGSASAAPSPRVASPDLLSPTPTRPFHRMSQSASGSMLDLLSRSPRLDH